MSRFNRQHTVLVTLAIACLMTNGACAHSRDQSYIYLTAGESSMHARFEVMAGDLNKALALGLPTDGSLTMERLREHETQIARYLTDRVAVRLDGLPATLEHRRTTLRNITLGQFVMPEFELIPHPDSEGFPRTIDVQYDVLFDVDNGHLGLLLMENNWRGGTFDNEATVSLTFTADDRVQQLELTGSTIWSGFRHMLVLGATHIIEGIDHVLFLAALLLTSVVRREAGRWEAVQDLSQSAWNVLKIVTLFTIAHSITLSLVTLDTLSVPPRLVESVIAASIIIVALDVFFPLLRGRIGIIVFLFGLFHGAGFATVLLEMSIHPDYLVLTLLAFNLGVELGQVAIVLVVFPLLFVVRARPLYLRYGMQGAAVVMITLAGYWFTERALGIDLPAGEYANKLLSLWA